ncbi:unnamed protein product [Candida verbasci]|uniref:Protoheme IX farnesyltransferase, mitochondrial n=1 Tax=Candida verbasci TaxID=1227364 RepID=A0A9W4XBW0_9ASCO|nr:unnamed protein product [Candida verbasci]
MISSKLVNFSKYNTINNFNYFFNNTTKNLVIDRNFISNQLLIRKNQTPILKQEDHQTKNVKNSLKDDLNSISSCNSPISTNYSVIEKVASKVLTCQEPQASLSQGLPFKISPKSSRNNNKIETLSIPKNKSEFRVALNSYIKLTKPNLTILVTLSAICSYAISPLSVTLYELLFLTSGTALCSGAANAINMGREPDFDRKMPRTVGRPVVRGLISPKQAYKFASLTGTLGCLTLWFGVNPTVAILGFSNIILYAWIYTSMKRKSILNTWVGAIVGAIPPLMGWAASSSLMHPGAWCLAGLLYAWQFPHFNALSHNIADQYKSAGYVMTAAENPKLNARVALRYSILMFPLCFGLSYFGVTDWVFPFDSAIANAWLTYLAFKFWKQQQINYKPSNIKINSEGIKLAGIYAKKLFWCSVWHLPAVLILAMIHKKDQWNRILTYFGFKNDDNQTILN